MHPALIAGYVALFVALGGGFLCVNLLVGWLVRPRLPNTEKLEVYECGEPAIGSSFVQFDLRFYVVALLFIIFDVEVALFFPWATVFGKAVQLADPGLRTVQQANSSGDAGRDAGLFPADVEGVALSPAADGLLRELGVGSPTLPRFPVGEAEAVSIRRSLGQQDTPVGGASWAVSRLGTLLARTAVVDMAGFFAVLLVGFAYVWSRGDLDWVRAVSAERGQARS
ncbi:MAG: NADH-quinone oxidoreductase subunit A [Planctomycetia bacterium]|nr:NADH-quinone oxidoreductase subunit A [Planctomycetia bacterium]